MSVEPPSRGWNVLGAVFMIVGGLLLITLGGVCSYLVGAEALRSQGGSMAGLLLLSLATLGAGVALVYQAVKLLRR